MKKFDEPIEVFEASKCIEHTDFESGVFRYNATGITYRSTVPKVLAEDGQPYAYLDRTYLVDDERVMEKLNIIARMYWEMHDGFQKVWEKILEEAKPLTEDHP